MLAHKTRLAIGLGAGATVFAAALACGPSSNVNSTDMVTLHGTAQDSSGGAQASTQVNLVRIPDLFEALTGGAILVGSLGTECLAQNPPPICSTFRHTTSGSDGTYSFALTGSDTQGSLGQAVSWYLEFSGSTPGGASKPPSTGATFVLNATDVALPALRLWTPTLTNASAAGQVNFTWTSLAHDAGADASGYTVKLGQGDAVAWQTSAGTQTTTMWDARAAEDFAGDWWVEAARRTTATATDVDITHRSQGLAFSAGTAVPLSRAKACQVQRNNAPAALDGTSGGGCPLTDGSVATLYNPAGPSCTPPDGGTCNQTNDNWVQVDLGSAAAVSLVYVRNYRGGAFVVEVSTDGSSFRQVATAEATKFFYEIPLPAQTSARYVRLRAMDATQMLGGFSEFSVF